MLPILALATLAVTTPAPINVQFTSDSVYTYESIISPKDVQEQEDGKYTIILEQDKLLGYQIYDNAETAYIDGLKFDDEFVTNYVVKDVDLSVEHTLLIKTVYTEDIAGMLAAAKDGDWSRALSNPLILFQLFYYILAALSIIVSAIAFLKAKIKKVKTNNDLAGAIDNRANEASETLKNMMTEMVKNIVTPVMSKMKVQQDNIVKAFVLAQSGDKEAKLALVDVLKSTADEDVNLFAETIAKSIEQTAYMKEKAKLEADKAVKQIAEGIYTEVTENNDNDNGTGGIAI